MRKFSTVKKGSTGTDVVVMQTLLHTMQFTGKNGKLLDINGTCDDNTVFAINSFQTQQRAYGYECGTKGKNDGEFGDKCWKRFINM